MSPARSSPSAAVPHRGTSGERVFGSISPMKRDGAFAEFAVAPAANLVAIPTGIDFAAAAALPVACGTAWQALNDDGRLAAGQRVLIIGAAGGVGHFAVQIAKHLGAHVVGVCSAANAAFVRGLGADDVVDYAARGFHASRRPLRRRVRRGVRVVVRRCAPRADGSRLLCQHRRHIHARRSARRPRGMVARMTSRQRVVALMLKAGAAMWTRLGQTRGRRRRAPAYRAADHARRDRRRAARDGNGARPRQGRAPALTVSLGRDLAPRPPTPPNVGPLYGRAVCRRRTGDNELIQNNKVCRVRFMHL